MCSLPDRGMLVQLSKSLSTATLYIEGHFRENFLYGLHSMHKTRGELMIGKIYNRLPSVIRSSVEIVDLARDSVGNEYSEQNKFSSLVFLSIF